MFFNTLLKFVASYVPYGNEIKASIYGPYFYNDQVYRDEEDYYNEDIDIEKGITNESSKVLQVVSYY